MLVLVYKKAIQQSIHQQHRIIREGQLRIVFCQDLKIVLWEFCVRGHDELVPKTSIAPRVHKLLHIVEKAQSAVCKIGSDVDSLENLRSNNHMFATVERELDKSLYVQTVKEAGFSKNHVRTLQVAQLASQMKDLMNFCHETELGPIEGLKAYQCYAEIMIQSQKLQMEKILANKRIARENIPVHSVRSNQLAANSQMLAHGTTRGFEAAAMAPPDPPDRVSRPGRPNATVNSLQRVTASNNAYFGPQASTPRALAAQGMPQFKRRALLAHESPPLDQQNHQLLSPNSGALENKVNEQLLHVIAKDNDEGAHTNPRRRNMSHNSVSYATKMENHTTETMAVDSDLNVTVKAQGPGEGNGLRVASNHDSPRPCPGNSRFGETSSGLSEVPQLPDAADSDTLDDSWLDNFDF